MKIRTKFVIMLLLRQDNGDFLRKKALTRLNRSFVFYYVGKWCGGALGTSAEDVAVSVIMSYCSFSQIPMSAVLKVLITVFLKGERCTFCHLNLFHRKILLICKKILDTSLCKNTQMMCPSFLYVSCIANAPNTVCRKRLYKNRLH